MSSDINKLRREPLTTYTEASSRSPIKFVNNQSGSPHPVINSDRSTSQDRKRYYTDSSDDAEGFINPTIDKSYQPHNYEMESTSKIETPKQTSPAARRQELGDNSEMRAQQTALCRSSHMKYIYAIIIVVTSILVCFSATTMQVVPSAFHSYSEQQVKMCTFEKLRQKQPLQSPEVWDSLQTNIEILLNKKSRSPNVFLLLHSNQSSQVVMKKLIKEIALEASKCFDGQRLIEMSLQDFETQDDDDYGYPIQQYKQKLNEGNVFLIVNLNDIQPKAARALHTICETTDPIEPDVVIFLTLRTNHAADDITPASLAYNTLQELWKDMPDNELGALITRVIDQVLLLQS